MAKLTADVVGHLTWINNRSKNRQFSSNLQTNGDRHWKNLLFLIYLTSMFSVTQCASLKVECQRYGNRHVVAEDGCQPVIVQLNICSGFCRSLSFFDLESHKIAVIGKCCRMVDSKWVNVTLNCDDGERMIKLPSATECRCFDCASDN